MVPLPPGRKTIKNKWVFKTKKYQDGAAPAFKARLVAKGYSQIRGIDYDEIFSPVVRHEFIRAILGTVASRDLVLHFDAKNAFLNGTLKEELYMEQPEGFIIPKQEDLVCRLNKSIYGLKEASRTWNKAVNSCMLAFGLNQSTSDPCVFYLPSSEPYIVATFWVDDGLLASNELKSLANLTRHIRNYFQITTKPLERFVGLHINRDRKNRELVVYNPRYTAELLERFEMTSCNHKSVPADPHTCLTKDMSPSSQQQKEKKAAVPYREAVGSLQYAAITFRPDIAYELNQTTRFIENPGPAHWNAIKQILAYLKGTANLGIVFKGGIEELNAFSDADFGKCIDSRRSISGSLLRLNGPVTWGSKRQSCVATSTT